MSKHILTMLVALVFWMTGCSSAVETTEETTAPEQKADEGETANPDEPKEEEQKNPPDETEKQDPNNQGQTIHNDDDKKSELMDSDGDTIADEYEGVDEEVDTDGDTTPDYLDLDSDDDTIPDKVEARNDGDTLKKPAIGGGCKGIADFRCTDSDGNKILDGDEAGSDKENPVDTDGDTIPDYCDFDNDGDGLDDSVEIEGPIAGGEDHRARKCEDTWCEPGSVESPWDSDNDTIADYMDTDSDNDTIPDFIEGLRDSDRDGQMDRFSTDSDADTIPDDEEKGSGEKPVDTDGDGLYDFQDSDSDNDGIIDLDEVNCENIGKHSRLFKDTDDDGETDLAEHVLAKSDGKEPADYICDNTKGVREFVEFYFELPKGGGEKTDALYFEPLITRADVFLNIDNTGSMQSIISSLQTNFSKVVGKAVLEHVEDALFGVSIFRDFDASPVWQLYSPVTDADKFNTALQTVKSENKSTDIPEAGYESLYEIATGDVSANGSAYNRVAKPSGIGGVGFRTASMPIILHITDAPSNEKSNGHNATQAFDALNKIGARVIHIGPENNKELAADGIRMSQNTNAVVPVCAYQTSTSWQCGEKKCCINDGYDDAQAFRKTGVDPDENGNCVLAIKPGINLNRKFNGEDALAYKTMLAIEALVKYGSYNVSTRIAGDDLDPDEIVGTETKTDCFIKRIEAVSYTPPSQEPEHSCLATLGTAPKDFRGEGYNDGFEKFAVGAAFDSQSKSRLEFKVVAENQNCVKTSSEARSYFATIEVYDPVTGLVFDRHRVAIVVPGGFEDDQIN